MPEDIRVLPACGWREQLRRELQELPAAWGIPVVLVTHCRCEERLATGVLRPVRSGALIILGGPMGAYEEETYPYLGRVQELIREAVAERVPTVGICLGGQLIARAFGAEVKPNPVKEIGWYPVRLTPEGEAATLFAGLPREFWVFQWHGDTFALPEGAVLLAQGEICANQAFVYRGCAWALQFHLEVTPEMVGDWTGIYADELAEFKGVGAVEALVQETARRWEAERRQRECFLDNLRRVLRGEGG